MGGFINHSSGERWLYFRHASRWRHDTNFTLTILYHLCRSVATGNTPAAKFDIQIDGAGNNTSKAAYGMCCLLGATLFREVGANRLQAGHSHGPIDQFFRAARGKIRACNWSNLLAALSAMLRGYRKEESGARGTFHYFPFVTYAREGCDKKGWDHCLAL
jgi:hypothetical protein